MARNQNRGGGGLVYHWRHGWIPRTPTAALQKAHGSPKGAEKVMKKHGIEGGLPSAAKKAEGPSGVTKSHPVGARVVARQPGIENETTGKVVGHTEAGMVRVQYKDRRGSDVTGTFNPSHTRIADSAAAKPSVADKPHTLKPGDRATVRGTDEYGEPMTLTGTVRSNGEVSAFGKGRTTGGQPLRSISIEREDNSKRQNVVYVPDPDRGEQKRGTAAAKADAPAKVRSLPAEGNFSGTHSENFMGEKITVRKTGWGKHETLINGEPFSAGYGSRNKDGVTALDQARKSIETMKSSSDPKYKGLYGMKPGDSTKADAPKAPAATKRVEIDHSGDGTTLTIDRGDTEAREAVKAAGFRWSSNLGAWYLPRTQHESTRRAKIAQLQRKLGDGDVNLDDGGRGNTTTAAEREAERISRAANRAERMDSRAAKLTAESERRRAASDAITEHIPMGQPILVGHHSQRRHERALERAHSNDRASWQAASDAKAAKADADRARRTAEGTDPLARQRRVDRNEAELRSVEKKLSEDDTLRKMAPEGQQKLNRIAGVKPLSSDYRDQLEASRDRLRDDIAHDKAQIKASGVKQVTAKDVTAGDMVTYRGRTYIVTKVNKTTVSVPSGYSWDDKIPLNQVQRHTPLSTQSDSAIQTAFGRATDAKVKAALRAELMRRGLTAA